MCQYDIIKSTTKTLDLDYKVNPCFTFDDPVALGQCVNIVPDHGFKTKNCVISDKYSRSS